MVYNVRITILHITLTITLLVRQTILIFLYSWSPVPPTALLLRVSAWLLKALNISMGRGKMMVEFFSAEMLFSVWKAELSPSAWSLSDWPDLEISELESSWRLADGVRGLPQSPAGLLFSLSRHHLGPGLPGGLGLGGHDSLELEGQPHVLDLHPLHVDAPGVRGHLQVVVHAVRNGLPVRQDLREVPGPEDVPDVFLLWERRHFFSYLSVVAARRRVDLL